MLTLIFLDGEIRVHFVHTFAWLSSFSLKFNKNLLDFPHNFQTRGPPVYS